MPSKAQRNRGAPLPDPLDGYSTVCFNMTFPDNLEYRTALMGAIVQLGRWYHWEKTHVAGDTRATEAATYLREFILTAKFSEECDLSYEIRFTDCIMEFSEDGGETWEPVPGFDPECFQGPQGEQGIQGIQGEPGICEDCGDPDPTEDDNGTPPPEGTPGDEQRCKIAQGVVDSLIDNYYIPVLDFWIDVFVTQGLTALQAVEALRLTLIGQTAGSIIWPPSAIGLIGSIGSALFGAMVAATSAAEAQNNLDIKNALNDTETRERIYCLLYLELPESGNIDGTVWNSFLQRLFDEGGIPFIDLRNYLRDNIPLYVARTEAFITTGGAFDCAECQEDACVTSDIDWDTTGATPEGWAIVPNPETFTWAGNNDLVFINAADDPIDYSGAGRASNADWTTTVPALAPAGIWLEYTFPEPCTLEYANYYWASQFGNSKIMVIAVEYTNGDKEIIARNYDPTPTPTSGQWGDSTIGLEVNKVYFAIGSNGSTTPQTLRISRTQINI